MIEAETGRIVGHIPVGEGPHEIAASPDGTTAAVPLFGRGPLGGDGGGNQIAVIDVETAAVRHTTDLGEVESPHGIVFLDDRTAVAVSLDSKHVVFIDTLAGTVTGKMETELPLYLIASSPDDDDDPIVYASSPMGNTIAEVDVNSKRIVRRFSIPGKPGSSAVAGDSLWLLRPEGKAVSVLDLRTGEIVSNFPAEGVLRRIAISPDQTTILATEMSEVRIFDAAERIEIGRIALGVGVHASGVTFGPDGDTAYVTSPNSNKVFELDVRARKVLRKFETQSSPDGIVHIDR